MSFLKIIKAFHKGSDELLDEAIDMIGEMVNDHPEEIDELVSFAIANLNENQFLFLFSVIEECSMSLAIDVTSRTSLRYRFYFIVLKAEYVTDSDPENVEDFHLTPILKKHKLLKNRIDESFFVPRFQDARELSGLAISDLHLYFRDTMESFPYLPNISLHKEVLLKNQELICLPFIVQEKEKDFTDPTFIDLYSNLSIKKKKLVNQEISKKFNKEQNKYQVIDIIPALDVKGMFIQEDVKE